MNDNCTRKDEYMHVTSSPPFKCSALDFIHIEDGYVLLLLHWCPSSVYSGPTVANMTVVNMFLLQLLKC